MLPRRQRLRTDRDVRAVLRSRRVARGQFLTLRVGPPHPSPNRFAFVVSRRVAPKAVDRNLLKRRLRSVARKLPVGQWNSDWIVIAQPPARQQNQTLLAAELQKLYNRLLNDANPG